MDTFLRFLYEFVNQIVAGLYSILQGIKQILNFPAFYNLVSQYKGDFTGAEWILVAITILFMIIFYGGTIFLVVFAVRKIAKRIKPVSKSALINEVEELNKKVIKLSKEKDEILAMKVSQLGLKPSDLSEGGELEEEKSQDEEATAGEMGIRFSKLNLIDMEYADYKIKNYGNTFDLPELCYNFRNFAASKLKLFYKERMIRTFVAGLASTRLVILQGISGTGKTSLAYAWGKFMKQDSCVASVQPSWRDRTDLFGYFNEFTKKFNETELLKEMYIADYTDDVYTVILDEMNLSRVEYYFAEMLSILEMPDKKEWIIEIVPNSWPSDPKKLMHGKIQVPPNMWYIGTINNDDSTFMVTDKVYDRAMPIDINDKGQVFEPEDIPAQDINYSYLDKRFQDAIANNPIHEDNLKKIEAMDDYVIQHFRIAFGNRIVAHMRKFVPVFVACGGDEIRGIDYFIARKILRKFEQLNIAYIRDEIDGFVKFLNDNFGENKMSECIEYLLRLKKMA